MKRYRQWLTALLTAAVLSTVSLPWAFALPAPEPFAELRIDASDLSIPDRNLSVQLYHQDEAGQFQPDGLREYQCKLNRTTQDAVFFIQASTDGVWVSVDYLTDIDSDGIYELLEDTENPVWDVMDLQGDLAPQAGEAPVLEAGHPYILSPSILTQRGRQAVQERTAGTAPEDGAVPEELPLCMIRLHYTDPGDSLDYEQTYYVQISDKVYMTTDVSPSDWYYDAVDFVLSRGYFTGSSSGLFLPDGQLTRAQLAQVLWAMSGSPDAQEARFPDVDPSDWFCQAVSWCQQEELITGYTSGAFAPDGLLTREQLFTVLYRYAQNNGISMLSSADLSEFADGMRVSPWAAEFMRWAVTYNLIHVENNELLPAAVVTRAELASVLYAYSMNFESYSLHR